MLGKMILQGAIAAAILGGAAAVYAQAADAVNQTVAPQASQSAQNVQSKDTGWLPAPSQDRMRSDDRRDREYGEHRDRKHKRDHDDDDD